MKDCFGNSFGFFMEDMIGDVGQLKTCYDCVDYDQCHKMFMAKQLVQLRFEIRSGVRGIRESLGGSHSSYPFG